jgi:hypothetical protein
VLKSVIYTENQTFPHCMGNRMVTAPKKNLSTQEVFSGCC